MAIPVETASNCTPSNIRIEMRGLQEFQDLSFFDELIFSERTEAEFERDTISR